MDEAPPAVPCPSSKFCMVVDGYGYITGRATGHKAARPGRREPAKGIPDGENLEGGHASQWDNLGVASWANQLGRDAEEDRCDMSCSPCPTLRR